MIGVTLKLYGFVIKSSYDMASQIRTLAEALPEVILAMV